MKKIVLFGVGRELKKHIGYLNNIGLEPYCFADNNPEKWGTIVEGKHVVNPKELLEMDCNILISCNFVEEITKQLEEMGLGNKLINFQPILKELVDKYADNYKYTEKTVSINKSKQILIDAFDGVGWGGMEVWSYNVGNELDKRGYNVQIYGSTWQMKQDEQFERLIKRYELNREDFWQTVEVILEDMEKRMPFTLINNWTEQVFVAAYILKQKYPEYVRIISVVHNDTLPLYIKQNVWNEAFDKIAGVSKKICKKLVNKYGIDEGKVCYKENFVSNISEGIVRSRNENEPIRIGWGARLEILQKRADFIPEFIEKLENANINYVFEIAGNGSYKEDILEFINENGYKNVNMLGEVPIKDMRAFWLRQHIYVNLSDFEGSSLAMLEAMSTGCVPVVTDVSGTDEFVYNDKTGYRCPIENIQSIVDKVVYLYENKNLLNEMSINAADIIREKCQLNEYTKYIEEVI